MQSTVRILPSKPRTIALTRNLVFTLFPYFDGGDEVHTQEHALQQELLQLLTPLQPRLNSPVEVLVKQFLAVLPQLREQLQADAAFIEAHEPATTCIEEVVMTYPGFYAIMVYRLAHELQRLQVPLVPRIMTEHAHSLTGIDIHPSATIGNEFFIDHGTGIVIGESTAIGKRVKIYQGVTLGALSVCKQDAQQKRHPTIEDDVVIYAGATILGGETTIGKGSIVGGNVWLTKSVPPFSTVYHYNKVKIRQGNGFAS